MHECKYPECKGNSFKSFRAQKHGDVWWCASVNSHWITAPGSVYKQFLDVPMESWQDAGIIVQWKNARLLEAV